MIKNATFTLTIFDVLQIMRVISLCLTRFEILAFFVCCCFLFVGYFVVFRRVLRLCLLNVFACHCSRLVFVLFFCFLGGGEYEYTTFSQ